MVLYLNLSILRSGFQSNRYRRHKGTSSVTRKSHQCHKKKREIDGSRFKASSSNSQIHWVILSQILISTSQFSNKEYSGDKRKSEGLLWWLGSKICLQCPRRSQCRMGFDPWVGKFPWRRKWQPTTVSCLGNPTNRASGRLHSPRGCKAFDRIKPTWHTRGSDYRLLITWIVGLIHFVQCEFTM